MTRANVNGDGSVDVVDVQALQTAIESGAATVGEHDLTGDGEVDSADVTALYDAVDSDDGQDSSGGLPASSVVVVSLLVIGAVLYIEVTG